MLRVCQVDNKEYRIEEPPFDFSQDEREMKAYQMVFDAWLKLFGKVTQKAVFNDLG